ncbi:succinate dehydrogenase, cytochrome b556 subunit [endosymbiont of unidentified scaly snail isolate Monju]|uniref:succinate dehydrogenase, cytochrome b556 subunit n=1 Tax=endosymbiont of unidentified scaly snail isolate Monju TaxID=1248727 RepID=UPI0003891C09|nr:succinate dehydrogenase, cytochrome b556 subunit [endosymbiont of unidentified scaly snail isolate Monju]BAN69179.1 succinate dehydrogenase cytochrome b556 subunit [endosymbiont of unidentified scaly snail isolate Monju]
MSLKGAGDRPVHLNLLQIRLPVAGVMSIVHRITGVLMFLAVPFMIYLLDRSLRSEAEFRQIADWLHSPLGAMLLFGLLWSVLHHLLAGLRYLLIDVDLGVDKTMASITAWLVLLAAPLFALLLAWGLL